MTDEYKAKRVICECDHGCGHEWVGDKTQGVEEFPFCHRPAAHIVYNPEFLSLLEDIVDLSSSPSWRLSLCGRCSDFYLSVMRWKLLTYNDCVLIGLDHPSKYNFGE